MCISSHVAESGTVSVIMGELSRLCIRTEYRGDRAGYVICGFGLHDVGFFEDMVRFVSLVGRRDRRGLVELTDWYYLEPLQHWVPHTFN